MAALRFKLDENVARDAAELLRAHGHNVHTVPDEHIVGEHDETIIAICRREGRILLTLDLGFADVRQYPPSETAGVIALRARVQSITEELLLIQQIVRAVDSASPARQLWIVEPGRVRVRG